MKKNMVHVIDNLGRGGAETMLVALLPELNKAYNVILVTLNNTNDFAQNSLQTYKTYNLNCSSKTGIFKAIFRLKKIIARYKPVLVRTQLYWSTIIGRLATPRQVPFFFSVHSMLSLDAFALSKFSFWLEKITYKKRHTLIAVSNAVLQDYQNSIGIKGKAYVLNNFIHPRFFEKLGGRPQLNTGPLKLVAVGNLKKIKNYPFLLKAIGIVKNKMDIHVDIIGEGPLKENLQKTISQQNLPVNLLGKINNVEDFLSQYHVYIMCSMHEGFGNAPVEAMAVGVPLILNDSDTMKEMSKGNAFFYETNNADSLAQLLLSLHQENDRLLQLSKKGREICKNYYNRDIYIHNLQKIYHAVQ